MKFSLKLLHRTRTTHKLCVFLLFLCTSFSASAQQISITELSDIDFGAVTPTVGRLQQTMSFCIGLDQRVRYNVTAWGLELGGAFELTSGPYKLPFVLEYSDRRRQRNFEVLTPGMNLTDRRIRGRIGANCRRSNAHIRVTLEAAEIAAAPAGNYQSTVTLMVSPE